MKKYIKSALFSIIAVVIASLIRNAVFLDTTSIRSTLFTAVLVGVFYLLFSTVFAEKTKNSKEA